MHRAAATPTSPTCPSSRGSARTLDRLNGIYGSRTHFSVWSTEYGFRTIPPDPHEGINPTTAAYYMNWAEYLSYKQARTYSYSQYGLMDQPPPVYFDTGLINPDGSPQARLRRLPDAAVPADHDDELRPAGSRSGAACARRRYASLDTGQAQSVQIEFQAGSTGAWQVIDTVAITNPRGYFDVHLAFPGSGAVRLAWTYPVGDPLLSGGTVYSRTQSVTVR